MSQTLVPVDSDRFDAMEKVANLRMQGVNDTQIAKRLDIQRKQVKELFEEYKDTLARDAEARDRARDALHLMVEHYDRLINESYKILNDLKGENFSDKIAGAMNTTIKNIADYEAKRLDAWQKAGLLDAGELGDELAQVEEQKAILIDILRNELCRDCQMRVAHKLQQVTNTVEATVVYDG